MPLTLPAAAFLPRHPHILSVRTGWPLQLVVYILVFLCHDGGCNRLAVQEYLRKEKEILLSREFWMFIGAFIIVLGAFQVMFTTSIPVFNKLLGTVYAPPSDSVGFYNRWQMPFALLIAGFIAFAQFLNYDENEPEGFHQETADPPRHFCTCSVIPFIAPAL